MEEKIKCQTCKYYNGDFPFGEGKAHNCILYKEFLDGKGCELFNADISNQEICFNCSNYLGGSDFGNSCKADYYTITGALNKKCVNFKWKEIKKI